MQPTTPPSTTTPHTQPNAPDCDSCVAQALAASGVYGCGKASNRLRATAGSFACATSAGASSGTSARNRQRSPCRIGSTRPPLIARSHRLGEQLAPDQHAADLAGAGADLVELGVAPQAAQRVLVDVAVAAEDLHALAGHPRRLLGGPEDDRGAVLAHLPHMPGAEHVEVLGHGVGEAA